MVAPKKEKLQLAETELAETMDILREKQRQLAEVERRLADLKATFNAMTLDKERLEDQVSKNLVMLAVRLG